MEHHTQRPDLQIVGGGLAGLLAANLAIDAGLSVRLVERQPHAGGRAATADHHGYRLNLGPHALYLEGELRAALVGLRLEPAGSPPELAGATGAIGDRVGPLPLGPMSLLRTALLSVAGKAELVRLLRRIQSTDPTDVAHRTVDGWLDGLTSRPDVRALLWGLTNLVTYNSASTIASAEAAVTQLQRQAGVRYVAGGWASIVDALDGRATAAGVERVTATVTTIETGRTDDDRTGDGASADEGTPVAADEPIVVTDDGRRLRARRCLVAAGGPAVADRLLGLGTRLRDQAGPPVEASVLDLGLRTRPTVGAHLGLDTGLYATVHSVTGGLAPAGRHLVVLARYRGAPAPPSAAGRSGGDDTESPERTRTQLLAHATQMGVDLSEVEMDRYLHRLMVTGGMPLAQRGGYAGRPTIDAAERPRVYLAGDWVGPRGLLADAAAASAVDAVRAAVAAVARDRGRSAVDPATLAGT